VQGYYLSRQCPASFSSNSSSSSAGIGRLIAGS
jgi:hypothetical protein